VRWSLGALVLVTACAQSVTPDDAGADATSDDAGDDASARIDAGMDASTTCAAGAPRITGVTALGGTGLERITAISPDPIDGSFAVAGVFDGDAFGTSPAAVVANAFHLTFRSSAAGVSTDPVRVYASTSGSELRDVFVDTHGSVTLGGILRGGTSTVERMLVDTGTSENAGLIVRLVTGMAPSIEVLALAEVNATSRRGDGYLVAGSFDGELTLGSQSCSSSDVDAFVAAFSFEGTLDWLRCFGGPGAQRARGVAVQNAGDVYVVGDFASAITIDGTDTRAARGASDGFVARFDGTGAPVWLQTIGATGSSPTQSLARVVVSGTRVLAVGALDDGDTGLVVADPPAGGMDGALVVLDAARGDVLRVARFGDAGDDELDDIAVDRCGRAWIVGPTALLRTVDVSSLALGSDDPGLDPHDVLHPTAVGVSTDGSSVLVGGSYVGAPTIAGTTLPTAAAPSDLFLMTIAR
jgi:hypothetical protein